MAALRRRGGSFPASFHKTSERMSPVLLAFSVFCPDLGLGDVISCEDVY